MKVFTSQQTKEIDALTIQNEPITSFALMKRASERLAVAMKPYIKGSIAVMAGSGNNGGDALIVAHILLNQGYNVNIFHWKGKSKSADCQLAFNELSSGFASCIHDMTQFPLKKYDCLIDGLFGTGLNRPLTGENAELVEKINNSSAIVLSIDAPSGLFGEDNTINDTTHIVKASRTFTIGTPKLSFFFRETNEYVGEWEVIDIQHDKAAIETTDTPYHYTLEEDTQRWIRKRDKFSHKGTFGHALLIAGSYGMMGAAQLASKAALRTGCGLLTAHIPQRGYEIMQIAVPEAIVSIDPHEKWFSEVPANLGKFQAIGIGPGLGQNELSVEAFKQLLTQHQRPMVIDADALNIMSEHDELWSMLPPHSILTPHPKEFERLAGKSQNGYDRLEKQIALSQKHQTIIVLKGANTSISLPDGSVHFNSSGNPCLSTAGSGDVLTGVILSLLAQGYAPEIAARLGVYLHGKAADVYAQETQRPCMLASDIVEWLWRK